MTEDEKDAALMRLVAALTDALGAFAQACRAHAAAQAAPSAAPPA